MEPGMYLTLLVLAIATLHLVNKTVTFVMRYRAASITKNRKAITSHNPRDDWYMFFHQSDLTGKLKNTTSKRSGKKDIDTSKYKRGDSRTALRNHMM